jgi:hypothetical protein
MSIQYYFIKLTMFSITPKIGTLTFLQNVISFLTSSKLTSCGVVTIIAPVKPVGFKYSTIERCSSDVPGGVSTKRYSKSSHSTSLRNCFIKPVFLEPLQMTKIYGLEKA